MAAERRKRKSDEVHRLLLTSLRAGHAPGERFLTVRAIARRHGVSMQTAQNLMKRLRVPEDVSMVMHDGNREPYEGFAVPPIASVGPSIQEIGKALAERMCRMLDGSGAKEPALQYLKPVVRVTGSVRRV